jgi:hypothetical protein
MLPLPVMQPVWEAVKDSAGAVDFRTTFHRAVYEAGYDNPDDIVRQRWRMEDVPWNLTAGPWTETYDVAAGAFVLRHATGATRTYSAEERSVVLATSLNPDDLRAVSGQGQRVILSRFVNPDVPANSYWSPSSVPAVKAQPWTRNYADKNVADNPVHPTVADLLIGPHRPVQYRRAKYTAVSLLTPNATALTGILRVVEGELEGEADLISLLAPAPFGWDAGATPRTTFPHDVTGTAAPLGFDTERDWYDRHHQYLRTFSDRASDFRNFRDRQTSSRCPELHHRAMAQHAACEAMLVNDLRYEDAPPVLNVAMEPTSYAVVMDTSQYEDCLARHAAALEAYAACVHADAPEWDALPPWAPGGRACVGGGEPCGPPPEEGSADDVAAGFVDAFTFARTYATLTNVYDDGGAPFRDAPYSRRRAYSRPPATGPPDPRAQDDGAYPRNVGW